ncbi:complement C1r subcomponent [Ambystoma mexicanum]|uniref:complement C1r subcomponent n=1 Tax=Ambystoma mexicanum TaxID=8296 RepID=UPI0037E77213
MWGIIFWCCFLGLAGSAAIHRPLFGEISSPKYPSPYPNNNVSVWDIAVPKGFSVKLTFRLFDLEPSESCNYDYVKISADKKDLGRYCGQLGSKLGNHPGQQTFMSRGNRMKLLFNSDFSNDENGTTIFYKGFLAYYQAVDVNECTQTAEDQDPAEPICNHFCHNYVGGYFCSCRPGFKLQSDGKSCKVDCSVELYTEEEGYISSPEYPQPYPPHLKCKYSIRLEKGLVVTLKFLDLFEIDDHQQVRCPYDLLQVQAGGQEIGSYCGRRSPGLIHTNAHDVDILFSTDDSGESLGWKIHYTSDLVRCPKPVPNDEYSIVKPWIADYRYQDYFIVTCKTGYKLMQGSTELTSFTALCQNDGTWNRPLPRCEIVSCSTPKHLANGLYKYQTKPDVNTYQSVIKYECNEPYYNMVTQSEEGVYTCTAARHWKDSHGSRGIPRCLPVCGKPTHPVAETAKIIGGGEAKDGNFPWQVYLKHSTAGGGALISDRWIFTAAHLIVSAGKPNEVQYSAPGMQVLMGDINMTKHVDLGAVEKVFVHPNYTSDPKNYDHDIALIKLSTSVTMNANIMPVCLPWRSNEALYDARKVGYVSGYGKTEENTLPEILRYVQLPVESHYRCRESLRDKGTYVFSDNMFCAGFPKGDKRNKDSCQGDSGGAFVMKEVNSELWMATGIVSWGIDCGRGYGFYTKLVNYRDWMEELMKDPPQME